jgi:hypothetical protein
MLNVMNADFSVQTKFLERALSVINFFCDQIKRQVLIIKLQYKLALKVNIY